MKATGIVRKVDSLGRIVLPMELRNVFNISEGDPLEIYVDGSSIILKKYAPGCTFCGSLEDVDYYKGKYICDKCKEEISKLNE